MGRVLRVSRPDATHQGLQTLDHHCFVTGADLPCRMVGVGELGGDVDLRTAAIAAAADSLADPREQGHELAHRTARRDAGHLVPLQPELAILTLEEGRDQVIFRLKVSVQARLCDPGLRDDPFDTDRADTVRIEQPRCGRKHARRGVGLSVINGLQGVASAAWAHSRGPCRGSGNRGARPSALDSATVRYHCTIPNGSEQVGIMNGHTIAVYGATGHTGRFVVRELERRGVAALSIGRCRASSSDESRGNAPGEWRYASTDDPDALDAALRGADALINCAGPFLDTAPALIEAALRAGIHYLDITAEQRSARQSLATYDRQARELGTVILPAMGFYGALADLLAMRVTRGAESVECIEIGVALDYWHPTEGTRKTGDRNTARRLLVADGKLAPVPLPAPVRDWVFPAPFGTQTVVAVPLSEVVIIHRHIAAHQICSYLNLAPLRDLGDPRTPAPAASDRSGRSSQRFVMDVQADSGGRRTGVAVAGRDIYAITAPIVVEACQRVLRAPPAAGGAYAPAELFDPDGFLAGLAPQLQVMDSLAAV